MGLGNKQTKLSENAAENTHTHTHTEQEEERTILTWLVKGFELIWGRLVWREREREAARRKNDG